MPTRPVSGLHHVTAIAGPPQQNLDFYAGMLGLRLVKRTVNFDAHSVYHLYFGDRLGRPGTNLTFFPWPNARPGQVGRGQVHGVSFAVPAGSLDGWEDHLETRGIDTERATRFGDPLLRLSDPDGLPLELIASAESADGRPWTGGPVGKNLAVRAFHGTTLVVGESTPLEELLTEVMGLRPEDPSGDTGQVDRTRFAGPGDRARYVDVVEDPERASGREGAGTVHHVAFRVEDGEHQRELRERVAETGLHPTRPIDRHYFQSVYFRVPGGILFELATDGPGFLIDEDETQLGEELRLPPWLESRREEIAGRLPELSAPTAPDEIE